MFTLALFFFLHEEGRVMNNSNSLRYEYSMQDHLGNTRLCFSDINNDGVADVLQRDDYYPFGLRQIVPNTVVSGQGNKYLYNNKELQDFAGLMWEDYGARRYDVQLGRWTTIDPWAEKYQRWSPYVYTKDNPIKFVDPDGKGSQGFWAWVEDVSAHPIKSLEHLATRIGTQIGAVFTGKANENDNSYIGKANNDKRGNDGSIPGGMHQTGGPGGGAAQTQTGSIHGADYMPKAPLMYANAGGGSPQLGVEAPITEAFNYVPEAYSRFVEIFKAIKTELQEAKEKKEQSGEKKEDDSNKNTSTQQSNDNNSGGQTTATGIGTAVDTVYKVYYYDSKKTDTVSQSEWYGYPPRTGTGVRAFTRSGY